MCLHLYAVTNSGGNNAKNSTKMKIGKGKANHDNPQRDYVQFSQAKSRKHFKFQ
jgi:hypothetical protein